MPELMMKEADYILNELKALAPTLVKADRQMPYSVPEGYFDQLVADLLAKLAPTPKSLMADVPEGYFESFPEMMLRKVKQMEQNNELHETAPTLARISKEMPYTVPQGYFEQLNPLAALQAQPQTKVPVVSLFRRTWMKVAAAVVIIMAAFGIWKMAGTGTTSAGDSQLAAVVNTDTIPAELGLQFAQLDDAELAGYLGESGVNEENRSQLYYLNTENFEQALQDFSATELNEQLEQNPVVKTNI